MHYEQTPACVLADYDTDEETDELLHKQYEKREKRVDIPELQQSDQNTRSQQVKKEVKSKKESVRVYVKFLFAVMSYDDGTVVGGVC